MRRPLSSRSSTDISLDKLESAGRHPFAEWYASLWKSGAAAWKGKDLYLDPLGAKRFAIGVGENATPILGIYEKDVAALISVRWSSAVFALAHRKSDWVALSCKDARVTGAQEMNPVPLRLWIPVNDGILGSWSGIAPSKLRLSSITIKDGKPALVPGPPLAEIPLALMGQSSDAI